MITIEEYIQNNKDRFITELIDFLKIPSISTESKYHEDTLNAADFLLNQLRIAGADNTRLIKTKGFPLVYGDKIISEDLPTLLVYGHYDVQPATPIEKWVSDPFDPKIIEDKIIARGAADDKGQLYIHIKTLEILSKFDDLPCNIKYIFEGEEESGSESFEEFLHSDEAVKLLDCDGIVVSDTAMISDQIPSLVTSLRGIVTLDLEIEGPNRDLHSGEYGGAVPNPIHILSDVISKLKDKDNKILIPHFYDDVNELSEEDKQNLFISGDNENLKKSIGITDIEGESGFDTLERIGLRPCLDVNGIWGGYTEEKGFKTVIPSKAFAKISMRLVPNQDHTKIKDNLEEYLKEIIPSSVKYKINIHEGSSNGLFLNPNSHIMKSAALAIEEVFGKKPKFALGGGSIPILSSLVESFQSFNSRENSNTPDIVMLGFGLPSDLIHSPNENFSISRFFQGIRTTIKFINHWANSNHHNL